MDRDSLRSNPRKGQPRNILTAEQRTEVLAAYRAGEGYRSLADRMGVGDSAIWGILSRAGETRTRHSIQPHELALALERARFQRSRAYLLPPVEPGRQKPKLKIDEYAFDTITPESAYWIGMMLTDGCIALGEKTVQVVLHLQTQDAYHIEAFKRFLKSNHKITIGKPKLHYSPSITNKPLNSAGFSRIAVGSDRIANALSRFGVVQRKSLSTKISHLEMHPDFWRGAIDGDGSVSEKHGITLFGTKEFVEQFGMFVIYLHPSANITVRKEPNVWSVRLSKKTSALLIYAMYSLNCPCLLRKKERADRILSQYRE